MTKIRSISTCIHDPYSISVVLMFLLVMCCHLRWVYLEPNADFWLTHFISTRSIGEAYHFGANLFGSPIYRGLYFPLCWIIEKILGDHYFSYFLFNTILHFFVLWLTGKIVYNRIKSIEVVALSYIFLAPIPIAAYSFGLLQFQCTLSVLLVCFAILIFQKYGFKLKPIAASLLLSLSSLSLYEAPGFILLAWGTVLFIGTDRKKYILFVFITSIVYLIPSIFMFPQFKMVYLNNANRTFGSIISFVVNSASWMKGIFLLGIVNQSWSLKDIINVVLTCSVVSVLWFKLRIADINTSNKIQCNYVQILLAMSFAIIGAFILIFVATWYQAPYLWYIPSFGLSFACVALTLLTINFTGSKTIPLIIILLITLFSQLSIITYQNKWVKSSFVKRTLIEYFDKNEHNMPKESGIILITPTPPFDDIGIDDLSASWTLPNIILQKYGTRDFSPHVKSIYSGLKYYGMSYNYTHFLTLLDKEIIEINPQTHRGVFKNIEDLYILSYNNKGIYAIGSVIIFNKSRTQVIKKIDFASARLPQSQNIYVGESLDVIKQDLR